LFPNRAVHIGDSNMAAAGVLPGFEEISVGDMCEARFYEDGEWYAAEVIPSPLLSNIITLKL
jgi:hypothetical protein